MKQVKRLFYKNYEDHDHTEVEAGMDKTGITVALSFTSGKCPNCRHIFTQFTNIDKDSVSYDNVLADTLYDLFHCKACGWWQLRSSHQYYGVKAHYAYQYHSILDTVDIASDHIDLLDLKNIFY